MPSQLFSILSGSTNIVPESTYLEKGELVKAEKIITSIGKVAESANSSEETGVNRDYMHLSKELEEADFVSVEEKRGSAGPTASSKLIENTEQGTFSKFINLFYAPQEGPQSAFKEPIGLLKAGLAEEEVSRAEKAQAQPKKSSVQALDFANELSGIHSSKPLPERLEGSVVVHREMTFEEEQQAERIAKLPPLPNSSSSEIHREMTFEEEQQAERIAKLPPLPNSSSSEIHREMTFEEEQQAERIAKLPPLPNGSSSEVQKVESSQVSQPKPLVSSLSISLVLSTSQQSSISTPTLVTSSSSSISGSSGNSNSSISSLRTTTTSAKTPSQRLQAKKKEAEERAVNFFFKKVESLEEGGEGEIGLTILQHLFVNGLVDFRIINGKTGTFEAEFEREKSAQIVIDGSELMGVPEKFISGNQVVRSKVVKGKFSKNKISEIIGLSIGNKSVSNNPMEISSLEGVTRNWGEGPVSRVLITPAPNGFTQWAALRMVETVLSKTMQIREFALDSEYAETIFSGL